MAAALPSLFLVTTPAAFAQEGAVPVLHHFADVMRLPGPVVAEAKLSAPETPMGITGYRVRHVKLSQPHRLALPGWTREVSEAWHVTVSFDRPADGGNQGLTLVIDGRWCGALQEGPGLLSADTVCFDAELFRDGAALGVTRRSIPVVSEGPEAERQLGPEAAFPNPLQAVHYASARLHLRGSK